MANPIASHQLEAFLAVAQTLNFTRAAAQLHLTQSALSQRIKNLEDELATTLFIRDRSGLRLTEAAHRLVRYGRRKHSLEAEFRASLQGEGLSGAIRIGGFSSVMQSVILPSLAPLLRAHPAIHLQMFVDEMDRLPARLRRGEIDYMVLHQREARDELATVALGRERNVLVQKKGYRGPDLYLDHDEADSITHDYLQLAGQPTQGLQRRYLANIYGLIEGVRLGLGRAVLPEHLIREEPALERVSPKRVLESPVFLYFYAQPYYSKLHDEIVRAIKASRTLT